MNCWKSCSGLLYSLGSAVLSVLLLWGHFLPQRPFDSFPSPILTVLLPSFPQWICRTCLGSRCITAFSRRQAEIKFIFLCLVLVWWHPIHYTSVVFIFPLRMECFVFINPKCFLVSSIPVALLLRLQCMLVLFSCGPLCYNVIPKYCGTMPDTLSIRGISSGHVKEKKNYIKLILKYSSHHKSWLGCVVKGRKIESWGDAHVHKIQHLERSSMFQHE